MSIQEKLTCALQGFHGTETDVLLFSWKILKDKGAGDVPDDKAKRENWSVAT